MAWGSNSAGVTWQHSGGNTGDFDLPGRITLSTVEPYYREAVLPSSVVDFDFTVWTSIDQAPSGDWILSRVQARRDGGDHVSATFEAKHDGSYGFALHETVNGAPTWLTGVALGSFTPGEWYRIRLQAAGSKLRAKVWTGDVQPDHWNLSTDVTVTSPGGVGLAAILEPNNTNVDPTVAFANLSVPNPQQFDVTRSVNGVVKPHDTATDVRLAHPSYIVL